MALWSYATSIRFRSSLVSYNHEELSFDRGYRRGALNVDLRTDVKVAEESMYEDIDIWGRSASAAIGLRIGNIYVVAAAVGAWGSRGI